MVNIFIATSSVLLLPPTMRGYMGRDECTLSDKLSTWWLYLHAADISGRNRVPSHQHPALEVIALI
jgi:hypothetical protein